jgi:hypothetical protein
MQQFINMKNLVFIILILLFTTACDKDESGSLESLNGTYKGFFIRSSPNAKYQPAEVTLIFNDSAFEGTSSISKYPAICKGTYKLSGREIEFNNSCFFTADFDWSLILSGKYEIYQEGERIIIARNTAGGVMDRYTLEKQ